MPVAEKSLSKLLYEVKRIAEHRQILTDKKIRAIYKSLMKDLNSFLAEEYTKYADADGRMYISYLDAKRHRAKFLQEIAEK